MLVKLAFDGGAGVASVGAIRFALAAVVARPARAEGDRGRAGPDAAGAVPARPDDLRARDRPLLRLAGADRPLARVPADVQLSRARRGGGRAAAARAGVAPSRPRARRRARRCRARPRRRRRRRHGSRSGSGSRSPRRSPTPPTSSSPTACSATTEPLVLATMLCAGAATAFALGGAATGSLEVLRLSTLLIVAAIALVATVLPIAAFLGGVHRIGPSRATILGTIEPPVTIALSALVFGERLGAGPVARRGARRLGHRDPAAAPADEASSGAATGATSCSRAASGHRTYCCVEVKDVYRSTIE